MSLQDLEDFEKGYYAAHYDKIHIQAITDVRSRRLHYYVQRRLIPPAIGSGPAARYTYEHVVRLSVLRILKERGLTLRQIKVVLDGYTVRELHDLAEGRDPRGAIGDVRCGLRLPPWGRRNEAGPLARVILGRGIELHISPKYHARAVMRLTELKERVGELLDVMPDGADDDLEP